jgi:hypothetical protein
MIRTVLLLAFTSLIISMFFLVGFNEGWDVAPRKLLGTAVVIIGAIILIMPSVLAWKGSNIAWKILAILSTRSRRACSLCCPACQHQR